MYKLIKNLGPVNPVITENRFQAVLPIATRIKSRARIHFESGEEAGLFLPRGGLIRGGDILQSEEGEAVEIVSAEEQVSTVSSHDSFTLMKAAYHLGNRHVPLEIQTTYIRYAHDPVLDDMIRGMGLVVDVDLYPFEPEAGAYHQLGQHSHA